MNAGTNGAEGDQIDGFGGVGTGGGSVGGGGCWGWGNFVWGNVFASVDMVFGGACDAPLLWVDFYVRSKVARSLNRRCPKKKQYALWLVSILNFRVALWLLGCVLSRLMAPEKQRKKCTYLALCMPFRRLQTKFQIGRVLFFS
ncbi:hypothetical protein BS50DRAFT_366357 [Corynespora cassiicola Philippines]|uniref:Uncharacterized protein n=1 Tax=Corynespora cassiicola Philippines TaxID=1448308 RepID=A0A2T2NSR8_CORCC|nr:hypothetical protein BS50DRAFT_366357 [Corynespora cassiicola Philippines]